MEIHEDVVQHCKESIARWKQHYPPAQAIHHIDVIHGNALNIAADKGEALLGFDRIYIGAAVDSSVLPRLKKLLKPGGVLVGPGETQLLIFEVSGLDGVLIISHLRLGTVFSFLF